MRKSEAIAKYYEAGYVWLDKCVHDYDDTFIEIPNGQEEVNLFQVLYKEIIEPVNDRLGNAAYDFVAFERGEDINSLRLYFGYPVSDCMESKDGTNAIVEHLTTLTH